MIFHGDMGQDPLPTSPLDPPMISIPKHDFLVVGTPSMRCIDPDGGESDVNETMTYRILEGSYFSYFSIDPSTAQVTFARDLDIDTKTLPVTVTLTLQCLDQKGASANADFTITIINSGQNETVHDN